MKRWSAIALSLLFVGFIALSQRASGEAGWSVLFDGKSLDHWNKVGDANWAIVDGAIHADKKTGEPSAFLVSKESYKDFEIKAEFFVDTGTNSGIFIRCSDPKKITAADCYEVNIWDARKDPTYGTGAIVNVAKVDPMPKAGGKWNTYEITAKGDHLVVTLNGSKSADVHDGKHAGGPIALQYGGGGVLKFRKVEIKKL